MTTETTTPTTATEQAPANKAKAILDKYVAQAKADIAADATGPELGTAEAREQAAGATGEKPRGADGKFVRAEGATGATGAAESAGATGATGEKTTDAGGDGSPLPNSIARVRRLFNEGKFEEAFTAAFGAIPEGLTSKQWAAWRAESRKAKGDAEQKLRAASEKEQRLAADLQRAQTTLGPLVQAAKLRDSGDLEGAVRAFFGDDVNTFQKKLLHAFREQNPEVAALKKQLAEKEQREEAQRREAAAVQRRAEDEQLRANYVRTLATEVAGLPGYEKAAKKPLFIQKVFEIQDQHYDRATDQTISAAEAAELAWEELYGDVVPVPGAGGASAESRDPGAQSGRSPARAATSVRQTAKPVTTLNPREASEAAPAPKLRGKALLDKYVRQAKANLARAATG